MLLCLLLSLRLGKPKGLEVHDGRSGHIGQKIGASSLDECNGEVWRLGSKFKQDDLSCGALNWFSNLLRHFRACGWKTKSCARGGQGRMLWPKGRDDRGTYKVGDGVCSISRESRETLFLSATLQRDLKEEDKWRLGDRQEVKRRGHCRREARRIGPKP